VVLVTAASTNYQIPDTVPAEIFRAYDIRGIVGQTLSADIVYAIGRATATSARALDETAVYIARDGRLSGPELSQALAAGLSDGGVDVIDIGCVPTPVLYFATATTDIHSGVMLTGSHNPTDYNGLKIVLAGQTLTESRVTALHDQIKARSLAEGSGRITQQDFTERYLDYIVEDVTLARPLKIVIDCGNGVAGGIAPDLFRRLGCEVITLFCDVDGRFPNHHPDPSVPENLSTLIETVKKENAVLGFAFDGDGDRCGVVTEKGEIIWPDRQLMVFVSDFLQRHPGEKILFDVKCSRHLAEVIEREGGQPVMWKTGHSLLKQKMAEDNILLAGEMSGHVFFKERWFGFDDGLYTAARLLDIVARQTQTLSAIFDALPDSINTPELKLAMPEEKKFDFMQALIASADFPGADFTTIDGLRVDFENGWGLVRPSNTTPFLILRFEADDEIAMREIQDQFRALLLNIDKSLTLPF